MKIGYVSYKIKLKGILLYTQELIALLKRDTPVLKRDLIWTFLPLMVV